MMPILLISCVCENLEYKLRRSNVIVHYQQFSGVVISTVSKNLFTKTTTMCGTTKLSH